MPNAPRPTYPDQDDDKYTVFHASYNRLSKFRREFQSSDAQREAGFNRTSIREAPRLLSNSPSINLISPSCTGKVDRAKMIIVYDTEIQVLDTYLIISLTTRAHGGTPEWNPMIALGGTQEV